MKKEYSCEICNKVFFDWLSNGSRIYCSRICFAKSRSIKYKGANNPCYRGGSSMYTCSKCGKKKLGYSKTCIECNNGHANWKGGIEKSVSYRKWYDNNKIKRRIINERRKDNFLHIEGSHTLEEWNKLKKVYHYMCLCCKRQEPEIKLTEDHIIPVSKGGTDHIWNIQPLCQSCNSRKKDFFIDYRNYFERKVI